MILPFSAAVQIIWGIDSVIKRILLAWSLICSSNCLLANKTVSSSLKLLLILSASSSDSSVSMAISLSSMMTQSYILYPIYISTFALLLVSLLFKMYSAPFHYWVADIYQAAPLMSTFYFSTVYLLSIIYVFFTFYLSFFCFFLNFKTLFCKETPNGLRYPQVGGRG